MTSVLSKIQAVLSDDLLRSAMASRQVLHIPGKLADPSDICTLADIERVLVRGAVGAADLSVFLADRRLDLETVKVQQGGSLRPLALQGLARQGATLVLNNLDKASSRFWDLTCEAERWLGSPATASAIASFGQSSLRLHYDPEDLIVVQVSGSKTWFLFGDPVAGSARSPAGNPSDSDFGLPREILMNAGDVLYVPSGQHHRCIPHGVSLHVGLLVHNASGQDFVSHVAQLAREDVVLNEPLQRLLGDDAVTGRIEAMKARLKAIVDEVDPLTWLNAHTASKARTLSLDFVTPELGEDGLMASLAVSTGPAVTRHGKIRAANLLLDATPGMTAVVEALKVGPRSIADFEAGDLKEALAVLIEKGVVRLDRSPR